MASSASNSQKKTVFLPTRNGKGITRSQHHHHHLFTAEQQRKQAASGIINPNPVPKGD